MSGQTTHPFTCNTCQVAFRSSELQRTHMQSDWHRYNLKRRVASLPPLSSEIFAEKVLANKATAAATAARASFEKGCELCGKTYYSENAYINHLSSQKHKSNLARAARAVDPKKEDDITSVMSSTFSLGEPAEKISTTGSIISEDAEEEFQEVVHSMKDTSIEDGHEPVSRRPTRPHHSAASEEERPPHPISRSTTNTTTDGRAIKRDPIKECLFCTSIFPSLHESLEHMAKTHGLFIPERKYLVNLEGLIKYLNQKINEEHECLFCGRLKWSEDGIKTHMRDMSHCKIAYETEDQQLEIGQFYDFRSTYSDDEWDSDEEMEDAAAPGGGVKLGAKRDTKTIFKNGDTEMANADGDEGGWETDSTASSVPTEELGKVYVDDQREEVKERLRRNRHHSHTDTRRHHSVDGWHSHAHSTPHAVYYDEFELHLPSGRTAGHRSLNKYFRQNLHNYPTPEERQQNLITAGSSDEETETRPRGHDRGRQLVSRAEGGLGMVAVTDAKKREVRAVEKRELKREQREQQKWQKKVDVKGNFQKHFRDPLLQ